MADAKCNWLGLPQALFVSHSADMTDCLQYLQVRVVACDAA